jgi:hypothetical protein
MVDTFAIANPKIALVRPPNMEMEPFVTPISIEGL